MGTMVSSLLWVMQLHIINRSYVRFLGLGYIIWAQGFRVWGLGSDGA